MDEMRSKLAIIGTGYVGLTTGACFAELGNTVRCMDNDRAKIATLQRGEMPIYEPGLPELIRSNVAEGRLLFLDSVPEACRDVDAVFICVGTPPRPDGMADVSALMRVGEEVLSSLGHPAVIVEKSTCPAGTANAMKALLDRARDRALFDVAVNPEFLREGAAVHDFMNPDRVVIGADSARARAVLAHLYEPLNAPVFFMNLAGAELTKHLSNALLSTKISFANSAARAAERVGADIVQVMKAVGLDRRIGQEFLNAGVGFGGFCFPKDLDALIGLYRSVGVDASLLEAVRSINGTQRSYFVEKVERTLGRLDGKTLGVLGLAFKPNTDDMRLAPSIDIIRAFLEKGARVKAYDPRAMEKAREHLPEVAYCRSAEEALDGADALVLLTEWSEFRALDMNRVKVLLKSPVILDGRNAYNPERMRLLGFRYVGVGR